MLNRFLLLVLVCCWPWVAQAANETPASPALPQKALSDAQKQAAEIDRLFGQLHLKNPKDPAATIGKIWALWSRNDSAMAEILLSQSDKAMQDGAFETSEKMLNELLASYPDYVQALNTRAVLYYNLKRYDEAMADVDAVLDVEPRHFGALAGKAAIYQAQGNVGKAAEALREAIAINPYMVTAKDALKQLEHDFPDI